MYTGVGYIKCQPCVDKLPPNGRAQCHVTHFWAPVISLEYKYLKFSVLTDTEYKCKHDELLPKHEVFRVTSVQRPRRTSSFHLVVSRARSAVVSKITDCSFRYASPDLWN